MPRLTTICFTGRLIHKTCLDSVFNNTSVTAVVVAGPPLTPLPFLADPHDYATAIGVEPLDGDGLGRERLVELASGADLGISLGYGNILRKRELDAPRLGTFNLHPSALPEYRGLHPDLYAMMDGRTEIGITLHRMDSRIDTGPIVSRSSEIIGHEDTIVTLTDRIYARGAVLIEEFLERLANDEQIPNHPQPGAADPLEQRRIIDWRDSAWRINNLVRALTYPWPMAKTRLAGKHLLVSRIRVVEDGAIEPGLLSAILDDGIRVGTGGHSVDLLELRDTDRRVIGLDDIKAEFQLVPGQTRFDNPAL